MDIPARARILIRPGLIVAFAIIAYLPSFDVPFTFDDVPNIVMNPSVHAESPGDLLRVDDYRVGRNLRPVAMFSFAVNHLFDGLDPFFYHVVNLVIHVLNGLLLYLLLLHLFRHMPTRTSLAERVDEAAPTAAMFAALAWVLHPANTQAVTYVVQRMTALSVTFYLLALLAFVLFRSGRLGVWSTVLIIATCFVAGMETKKIIITLPAALWLLDVIVFRQRSQWHRVAAGAIAVFAVIMIGYYATSDLADFWRQLPRREFSGYERLLTQGSVLWHYIGLYLFPWPDRLQLDYDWPIAHGLLEAPWATLAWAAWIGVALLAWRARFACPWPAFALLFFLVASSVESSFVNLEMVFEHRLYLTSLFIAPAIIAVVPWSRLRGRHGLVLWLLVVLLALGTIERNRQWAQFEGFWVEELERGASPGRAAINAALRYNRLGRPEEALALLDGVSRRYGTNPKLEQQRAEALLGLGRYAEAEHHIELVIEQTPEWRRAHYFHGQILLQQGRVDAAHRIAERMREAFSDSVYGVSLLALVLQHKGRSHEGIEMLKAYLADPPSLTGTTLNVARSHLANLYLAVDRPQDALAVYREIVERDPENFHAWAQIYRLLRSGGDAEHADEVMRFLQRWGVDPAAWETDGDVRAH